MDRVAIECCVAQLDEYTLILSAATFYDRLLHPARPQNRRVSAEEGLSQVSAPKNR